MLVQWSCIPKSSKCPTRKIERLDGDIGLEPAMDAIAAQVGETRDRVRNVSLTGGRALLHALAMALPPALLTMMWGGPAFFLSTCVFFWVKACAAMECGGLGGH